MTIEFRGIINVDVRDSVSDQASYEAPEAPAGAPGLRPKGTEARGETRRQYHHAIDIMLAVPGCCGIRQRGGKAANRYLPVLAGIFMRHVPFRLSGTWPAVGRDSPAGVSEEHRALFSFAGGTIYSLTYNVSGEPCADSKKEAMALSMRQ